MKKPIRICYLCGYLGIVNRGVESFSIGLLENLKKTNKYNITLVSGESIHQEIYDTNFTYPVKPPLQKGIFSSNFITDHLAILGLSPLSIATLISSISIFNILYKGNYNVLIPTNNWELLICKIIKILKKSKPKIIFVGHAGPGHDDYKALILNPDIFIALTLPYMKWVKKMNHKINVQLIPLGIDENIFNNTLYSKIDYFNNKNITIVYVGALIPYKRPEKVLDILNVSDSVNIIMVGTGNLETNLKQKYKAFINNGRLIFTGKLPREEVAQIISSSDILIMPSTENENSPTVILEAISLGKPVICTKFDRTEWLLKKGGILLTDLSPESITKSINEIITKYDYYSNAALKRSNFFKWGSVVTKWEKVIDSL